ncbi:MAG: M20/M25/M40 family metallo-hydrolase [Chitinophagaceae bacterium]|nr:M20/M25/M40 family metallo-hydrolase [Chitinophagaceae bacterium]
MFTRRSFSLLLILSISSFVFSQKLKKADKAVVANLQAHVSFLADDKLEGRRAGTNGEKLAAEYISQQFKKAGIQPKGDNNTWLQSFEIYDGKQVNSATHLIINGNDLKLNSEYFPLSYSANKSIEAAVTMALLEGGAPWFIDLKDVLEENKDNPHFDLDQAIIKKAEAGAAKGASALMFFNSSQVPDNLQFSGKNKLESVKIPVIFLTGDARKKYLSDESATMDIKLKVDIGNKQRTGSNVVGYIDNGAANTVILGAHYDHLGYGEDGNSLHRTNERSIHNGADDNASGTAALIELASQLKTVKSKTNNYLFIAFSGEELGLNGSKYFTEHSPIDLKTVNYMINMDMVGRLNDSSKTITVGGIGTSPSWSQIFKATDKKKSFNVKFDSSGTGPSDHSSFYRKDIPVLFFFTGLHTDYHKPSDDFNKINYTGELQILKYILSIIDASAKTGKLAFAKTREQQMSTSARFGVTMGIMPDYTFSGSGIKVDGISEGRPAQKAGLQTGDVIIQLGEHNTSSMEAYMQALSKFKKGDKAKVKYKRGNDVAETEVQF